MYVVIYIQKTVGLKSHISDPTCFLAIWFIVFILLELKVGHSWGAWVTQLVKHPTLGFGLGHDLKVVRSSPTSGYALSGESAGDSLSLPLPLPPCTLSLSQINK